MKTSLKKFAAAVGIATFGVIAMSSSAWAQALEKQKVSIAVGGTNLF
jgi:NitT/TauT family transport system substrate-binding protein